MHFKKDLLRPTSGVRMSQAEVIVSPRPRVKKDMGELEQ